MSTKPVAQQHLMSLDLLRGVAALCVVVMHWLDANGSKGFHYSLLAVDFFFVLSGFVVSYSYRERLRQGMSLAEFMTLRVIRLYPMILVGVVIGVVRFVLKDHFDPAFARGPIWLFQHALLNVFMVPAFMDGFRADMFILDSALWSLFFEFLAYLLYALVLHRLSVAVLVAIVLGAGTGVWAWLTDGFSGNPALAGQLFGFIGDPSGTARVLFSFCLGVLAHELYRRNTVRVGLNGWIAGGALLGFFALPQGATSAELALLVMSLLFPLTVVACAKYSGRLVLPGFAKFLGEISYPIYVVHAPLLWLLEGGLKVAMKASPAGTGLSLIWYGLLFIPLATALSYALYRTYDLPVRSGLSAWRRARCGS